MTPDFKDDNVHNVHLILGDDRSPHVLEADVVILGIGVYPSTDYLKDSNVQLDDQGYVITNLSEQYLCCRRHR